MGWHLVNIFLCLLVFPISEELTILVLLIKHEIDMFVMKLGQTCHIVKLLEVDVAPISLLSPVICRVFCQTITGTRPGQVHL